MDAGAGELAEVQQELQLIKKALRDGTEYLGMRGENLTKYLFMQTDKENLLYKNQLRHMSSSGGLGDSLFGSVANGNGGSAAATVAKPQVVVGPARQMPEGPAKAFNRDDLGAVVTHMSEYEASTTECTKALRALSSLAYSNAARVGGDDRVLPQLLRLLALHPDDGNIRLGSMRVLCNAAYDQATSLHKLSDPGILCALLASAASADPKDKAKGGEAAAKAGEAVARIVAAEVTPETNGNASRSAPSDGPLASLFLAAAVGEAGLQRAVPTLVKQLIANEVCEGRAIAERFAASGERASTDAAVAIGWMSLAKLLVTLDETIVPSGTPLPQSLVDAGSIRTTVRLMKAHENDAAVQLTGVETMSALVGNRWSGLQAFAEVGGMKRVEEALGMHGDHALLQTKGIRALASGIQWPEDIQTKAQYDAQKSIKITKAAMARHSDVAELILAGLEALAKNLDKSAHSKDAVMSDGGEGLVKLLMTKHRETPAVQQSGRIVLNKFGVDPKWVPGSEEGVVGQS